MIQSLSLQHALKYGAKGWKLFPARWDPLKKRHIGLVKWSKAATSDAVQIEKWAGRYPKAYFCVALEASDLTVLDVDDKNGKNGSDALKVLELINGGLPKTLTVQTPSGGRHYFFEGWRRQTVGVLGEGLDTPGMAPIPGSDVSGKGSYKVMEDIPPAAIPGWISDQLGRTPEKSPDCDIPAVELDQDHNLQWARQYAREAPPAVEGDGGDLRTFVTAASIRDRGLSEEACLDIMAEEYNPRCLPPWEFDDFFCGDRFHDADGGFRQDGGLFYLLRFYGSFAALFDGTCDDRRCGMHRNNTHAHESRTGTYKKQCCTNDRLFGSALTSGLESCRSFK